MNHNFKTYNNYETHPAKVVNSYTQPVLVGFDNIKKKIKELFDKGKKLVVIDLYPGVDKTLYTKNLESIAKIIDSDEALLPSDELHAKFDENITDDLVFGIKTHKNLIDCFSDHKISQIKETVANTNEPTIVIGVGAGLISTGECYIYANLSRREIQLRYQLGGSNWLWGTANQRDLAKTKQSYFVEWVLADKHKDAHYDKIDYMIDDNQSGNPKMIFGEDIRKALEEISTQPFRLKPFFAPGIWGGQWMKHTLGLDDRQDNYAWCFDGVPEENSLLFTFGDITVDIPAIDLVLNYPKNLLGDKVYGRYGKEFPIRFNLLDLMGGGNLSLQVHPTTEYVQRTFGANYTQDESYYILDSTGESCVYLGIKEGVDKNEFTKELLESEKGGKPFDDEKFINKFPVKKHDHLSIPGGTIHSAGKNTMVLEISATPNIFTFKLWDWGRVDSNGIPRPIHSHHGLSNIQWERDTTWLEANALPKTQLIKEEDSLKVYRTGLHLREPLETHRLDFSKEIIRNTEGNLHVINLVEGKEAEIHPVDASYAPLTLHYAETVIIPAAVGRYKIIPKPEIPNSEIKIITAFVR